MGYIASLYNSGVGALHPRGGDGRGTAAGRRCPAELGLGFGDGSNWEEKWVGEGERERRGGHLLSKGAGSAAAACGGMATVVSLSP